MEGERLARRLTGRSLNSSKLCFHPPPQDTKTVVRSGRRFVSTRLDGVKCRDPIVATRQGIGLDCVRTSKKSTGAEDAVVGLSHHQLIALCSEPFKSTTPPKELAAVRVAGTADEFSWSRQGGKWGGVGVHRQERDSLSLEDTGEVDICIMRHEFQQLV